MIEVLRFLFTSCLLHKVRSRCKIIENPSEITVVDVPMSDFFLGRELQIVVNFGHSPHPDSRVTMKTAKRTAENTNVTNTQLSVSETRTPPTAKTGTMQRGQTICDNVNEIGK